MEKESSELRCLDRGRFRGALATSGCQVYHDTSLDEFAIMTTLIFGFLIYQVKDFVFLSKQMILSDLFNAIKQHANAVDMGRDTCTPMLPLYFGMPFRTLR